jgi:hypothetical protein
MTKLCAAILVASPVSTPLMTSALAQTSGVSQDIRLQATVPTSCLMRSNGTNSQILVTGQTDDGQPVAFAVAPSGGMSVQCNTSYALSLKRITTVTPSGRSPSAANGNAEKTLAQALTIEVALAARNNGAGVTMVEQRCTFTGNEAETVCTIVGGADDVTVSPPRGRARFALITPGEAKDQPDALDLDELARAAQAATSPFVTPSGRTTASLRQTIEPSTENKRQPASHRTKIISENLQLSVSGKF